MVMLKMEERERKKAERSASNCYSSPGTRESQPTSLP